MLERAKACLDTGARLSLRCARRAPRSKRLLHSTFWSHGAGDLDLPPWASTCSQSLQDTPLWPHGDCEQPQGSSGARIGGAECSATPASPFLDFLYPPHALALLHSVGGEHSDKWVARNARRLPKGFVQAKRRYTSKSHHGLAVAKQQEGLDETKDDELANRSSEVCEDHEPYLTAQKSGIEEWDHDMADEAAQIFPSSASDQDQKSVTSTEQLRAMMSATRRNIALNDTHKSMAFTNNAWSIYERLEVKERESTNLKAELLRWLATNHNEVAETHCLELYNSIDPGERTMAVYKAALSVFLRCNLYGLAEQGHSEALKRLREGPELSAWLCTFAIEHQLWDMAFRIKQQLDCSHDGFVQNVNAAMFWQQISKIPDLLAHAIGLAKHYRMLSHQKSLPPEFAAFCTRIFKDALVKEFLTDKVTHIESTPRARQTLRGPMFRYLLRQIQIRDPYPPAVFRDVLMAIVGMPSEVPYHSAHYMVSYMYRNYSRIPGVIPDEELLLALLHRVTEQHAALAEFVGKPNRIGIETIAEDWQKFHGKLSLAAIARIMSFFSRRGDAEKVTEYFGYLLANYPEWKDREQAVWPLIYVRARRAETAEAKQAFQEIQQLAQKAGTFPELRCWNILIHAYARAGDLDNALNTLQEISHVSGLLPSEQSFHPVMELYAANGDVESVESLIDTFDNVSGRLRTTALYSSLLNAHINNGDILKAGEILQGLTQLVNDKKVYGSLTGCFNILLTAYAVRREIDEIMRAYRWMKTQKVAMDANTYAALIMALSAHRSIAHARQILTSVMPQHGIEPTAFHYAIIFSGYVQQGMFQDAVDFHGFMKRKNVLTSLSSNVAYLRAKAILERKDGESNGDTAYEELCGMMQSNPEAGISSKQPQLEDWTEYGSIEAALLGHFVLLDDHTTTLEAAQQLIDDYKEKALAGNAVSRQAPIRVLGAVIGVYSTRENWEKVEECWKLAKDWADAMVPLGPVPRLLTHSRDEAAPNILDLPTPNSVADINIGTPSPPSSILQPKPTDSDTRDSLRTSKTPNSRSGVAPGLRFILSTVLRRYISALSLQERNAEMISTVARVLSQGYALDNRTWNVFIEHLLRPSPPLALLAFRLVERYLIPNFPGWDFGSTRHHISKGIKSRGLQYMRARHLRSDQLVPQYRTLVKLGAALLELRRMEAVGGRRKRRGAIKDGLERYVGTTKSIKRFAPRTVYVVQSMPAVPDNLQNRLLRKDR